MSDTTMEEAVKTAIIECDVALLNGLNVSDKVMSLMAAEHAARVQTLCGLIDPTLGQPMLLMIANALIETAKQIQSKSYISEVPA